MERVCYYYMPDFRESGKGCCAHEGFQKMRPHPTVSNCWILHPAKNPIDHPVVVEENQCRDGSQCPAYSMEWELAQADRTTGS